jgi:hypothetical protein
VAISSNFRPDLLAKALRLFIIIPVLFTFFLSQIRISSTTATSKELSQDSHLQHQAAPFFFSLHLIITQKRNGTVTKFHEGNSILPQIPHKQHPVSWGCLLGDED